MDEAGYQSIGSGATLNADGTLVERMLCGFTAKVAVVHDYAITYMDHRSEVSNLSREEV